MKKIITLLVVLSNIIVVAQKNNFDHKIYVEELKKAKEFKYNEYLKEYNSAIKRNPQNIDLKIEKCEFINYSYYDEYEDYSLNYEDYEKCVNTLYKKYPNEAKIVLFKMDNSYGDSLQVVLDKAERFVKRAPRKWNDYQASKLYYSLANNSYNIEEFYKATTYLTKAKSYKDTTDNSILAANIYIAVDRKEDALQEILAKIDIDSEAWQLNRKASLLMSLNAPNKALEVYKKVEEKDSSYVNNTSLSKTFEDLKQYDIARQYLVKDTINEWRKAALLSEIVNFDLKYSDANTALASYRASQKEDFYDDFWGIKRLKIFYKSPLLGWSFNELLHLLILIISVVVLFIIPYILILPIQFLGKRFKLKPKELKIPFDWNLKHFWLVIFVYFLIDFLLLLIFDYQGLLNAYFTDYSSEDAVPINVNFHIAYFTSMFFAILLFLNKERVFYLIHSNITILRTLSLFVVFMILNLLLARILKSSGLITIPLNIREEVKEIIRQYGFSVAFLFVVVLVPIYEEIIFRGILLSSIEKHLGFWKANVIQAILFALVHQNFTLFLFYLFFAIFIGLIVKKSKGLLTGILFHAGNNFIFLIVVYNLMLVEALN